MLTNVSRLVVIFLTCLDGVAFVRSPWGTAALQDAHVTADNSYSIDDEEHRSPTDSSEGNAGGLNPSNSSEGNAGGLSPYSSIESTAGGSSPSDSSEGTAVNEDSGLSGDGEEEILERHERQANTTRRIFTNSQSVRSANIIYGARERSSLKQDPSYVVVAPRLARPSTVYRLVVGILSGQSGPAVDVTAQMSSKGGAHHNAATVSISPGNTELLQLMVPDSGAVDSYTLTVEGKAGHALVFRNSTYVQAASSFLTILVHLSRPMFSGGQEVGIRVILLTTEMKPYQEPIEAHILDPKGNIVKRWISRTPRIGVASLKFLLPELPEAGWWRVRIVVKGQVEEKKFLVYKMYEPLFEVVVEMPYYAMASDEEISGTLSGSFATDKPILGNATLTLYAKQPWSAPDSEFKRVSSVYFHQVKEEMDFSFPMSSLLAVLDQVEGAEVRVDAVFYDVFTWIKAEHSSRMRILSGRVHLEVVGTDPFVFRPGMPFNAVLSVKYADGEPLSPERLAFSSVVITATVTKKEGRTSTLAQIIIPTISMDQQGRLETLTLLQMGGKDRGWVDEVGVTDEMWVGPGPMWVEKEIEELLANYSIEQSFAEYRKTGIFRFHFDMPEDAIKVRINVVYSDSKNHQAETTVNAHSYYSPEDRYLQVTSSTEEAKVGEFCVFHVRSNFPVAKFVYLIMSKGVLIHSATEVTQGENVVTISVPVSQSMAPRFNILVYVTSDQAEVIADSLSMPVTAFENMEISLLTNQHKDHSKKTVEVVAGAPAGSFYALTCQRSLNYNKQHPNAFCKARIVDQMARMEPMPRSVHGVLHKSRDGSFSDQLFSLPSSSYGQDALATFQGAYLVILTDAVLPKQPGTVKSCNLTEGQLDCGDGECFYHEDLCDGIAHCRSEVDELGCNRMYDDFPTSHEHQEDPQELTSDSLYRLMRGTRRMDEFDIDDVEWCNSEIWIGHDGKEVITREIAKTKEDWIMEGYAIHQEYGMTLTSTPIVFIGDPPFYMSAEGPSKCRRGEQISIRVLVFNVMETPMQAVLLLHDNPDYLFIHVEEDGKVLNFQPRTSAGQHQHLLFIEGGGSKEVAIPLAIVKQSGMIEVTVEAVSQLRQDSETLEIEVMPEGVPVRKHTSLLLDLENRALVYEFLDVPVDESPIIPLSIVRRFISGSPSGSITLSGGVFGPMADTLAVEHAEVFGGRHSRSTDGIAYNFGATLWSLHYLRLTNNFNIREVQPAFEHLTTQLSGLLWRSYEGGFSMWTSTPPSVWLTAKVVNLLLAAQHEEWENYLYIDPKLIKKSIGFLLKYQSSDGGFKEEGEVFLDSKARKKGHLPSIPLTALVMVVLQNSLSSLQGSIHTEARSARFQAKRFLEKYVSHMDDCYHLAITAYALMEVGSPSADVAAAKLLKKKKNLNDMTYWSLSPMTVHKRRQENNQKAFLLPREPEEYDAHAVETTSYALLFYLMREGVTENTERIMRWLNAIRDWESAFISTSDSVVAMQALAEYAFRARIRDVMNMECAFEVTAQPMNPFQVSLSNISSVATQNFKLDKVWGHVNLVAKGSGQAVVQLDVSWGVDVHRFIEQPQKKYFDFSVVEDYHQFRNKSLITITVCASWLANDDGNTSHAAMVEVETPTGYIFYQPLAEETVLNVQKSESFPQLRNVHTTETHVFWQFEYIPSHKQCFNYDIQRWYPTANLTRVRSASIMEIFSPEHFEMVMVSATPLASLDICEVCGSYQCPYCPDYSSSVSFQSSKLLIAISVIGYCWFGLFLK